MATNQVGNKAAVLNLKPKVLEALRKPDSSATAAMKELQTANRKEGSVSGQEMMDAIIKGTKDYDNQAAGSEFAAISKFVEKNGKLLSPEAKKVYAAYEKAAHKAQHAGHTGIDFRAYQALQRDMRAASTVKPQDASSGKALKDLAKDNKTPGSISGKDMTDAIISATKDLDNQAAGKEFADIAKFVKENEQLLSPAAKKAFAVYERAVKAAKADGQTGIPLDKYNRMVRDMIRASAPPAPPASASAPSTATPAPSAPAPAAPAPVPTAPVPAAPAPVPAAPPPSAGVPPPSYGGGAPPPPMAGVPSAEQGGEQANFSIPIYGQPSVPVPVPSTPTTPTIPTTPPVTVPAPTQPAGGDASTTAALAELSKNNTKPGSVSGREFTEAVIKGTQDHDNQAAGAEYADLKKWVNENGHLMSPEAKASWAVYERTANASKAKGQTGILLSEYNKMEKEMRGVSAPKYQDASTKGQLEALAKGNTTPGSISAKELTDAVYKGARDLDNQSAGREFQDVAKFVRENEQLLSPEAKAAFAIYEKTAGAAQAKGQTGISLGEFNKMIGQMRGVQGGDKSATAALDALSKGNTKPGSVSGQEFTDAVIRGTKDLDNQAAGKEYADVAKWVQQNGRLMSPEAKKAWAVYENEAKAAQAKGETGIPLPAYNKMEAEMKKVSGPNYQDRTTSAALQDLAKNNKTPGSISAKELTDAVVRGTRDLDNQSAGKEYADLAKFVKENEQLLSPGAKQAFATYEKAAKAAQAKKQTGIPLSDYTKMVREMRGFEAKPVVHDASATKALTELGKANTRPGSISGDEMTKAIVDGTKDLDNQAAGREFQDISKWVKANEAKLSPEAKAAYAVYEKHAKAHAAKGDTGIPLREFNQMEKEMKAVAKPKYQDRTSAGALTALAKGNTTPGSISAKELTDAVVRGTRDFDNQAAGKEYADIAKFVKENEQLLSPEAKRAFAVYEKAAKAAQKNDLSGIPLSDYNKMVRDMRGFEPRPRPIAR